MGIVRIAIFKGLSFRYGENYVKGTFKCIVRITVWGSIRVR